MGAQVREHHVARSPDEQFITDIPSHRVRLAVSFSRSVVPLPHLTACLLLILPCMVIHARMATPKSLHWLQDNKRQATIVRRP